MRSACSEQKNLAMNSLANTIQVGQSQAEICRAKHRPTEIGPEQIHPAQIGPAPVIPSKTSQARANQPRGNLFLMLGLLGVLQLPGAHAKGAWHAGVFPVSEFLSYTSHYGSRIGPGGSAEWHHGLDIAAPLGTTIRSWWTGVVQDLIDDERCGIGLVIRSGAYEHVYCHLAGRVEAGSLRSGPVTLVPGQWLRAGQPIGQVGMSGRTTGPHLHWGLRYRGSWLDPARILRAMVESRRALVESRRALVESQRALVESRRALTESRRPLVESQRALAQNQREIAEIQRRRRAVAPKGPYGPSVDSFR
jgi:murein DD-endopeptidase MepM/ murein hydrolase activator NlpD